MVKNRFRQIIYSIGGILAAQPNPINLSLLKIAPKVTIAICDKSLKPVTIL